MNWLVRKPQQTAPAIMTVDDWLTGTGDGRRDADFHRDLYHPDPTQAITCRLWAYFLDGSTVSTRGSGRNTAEAFDLALKEMGKLVTDCWKGKR